MKIHFFIAILLSLWLLRILFTGIFDLIKRIYAIVLGQKVYNFGFIQI